MSEQTRIDLHTCTLYAFTRHTRHSSTMPARYDEAVNITSPNTLRLVRGMYRALRDAGIEAYDARMRLWLILIADGKHVTIERHAA